MNWDVDAQPHRTLTFAQKAGGRKSRTTRRKGASLASRLANNWPFITSGARATRTRRHECRVMRCSNCGAQAV